MASFNYLQWHLKSKEVMGETPFNYVLIVDIAYFVHQRALCKFLASKTYSEHHKQHSQLIQAVMERPWMSK